MHDCYVCFLRKTMYSFRIIHPFLGLYPEALLTGLQCEGNQLTLECPSNYHIQISTAFYGRQDARTCSHESAILSTNCSSTTSLSKVSQLCQSKRICDVYAFSSLLGDPCEGTFKYLEVAFSCFCE